MANFQYTSDIKSDVLFRAGENTSGTSSYDGLVLRYINRAQNAIVLGGCEFGPKVSEDWWWARKDPPGILILESPYEDGDATVTNNNTTVVFSDPPSSSKTGWFFRTGTGDMFRIASHVGGDPSMTLDSVYTGVSGTKSFTLFKVEYSLAPDVMRIVGAMRGYTDGYVKVDGCEVQSLDRDYPIARIQKGIPDKFAPITERKVRFNRFGKDSTSDGGLIRLEYDYLMQPPTLVGGDSEEPIVPPQFRYLLADMALFWLYLTKDDNRDEKLADIASRGIAAMAMENQRRKVVYGNNFGRILTRGGSGADRHPLRTESGSIIG